MSRELKKAKRLTILIEKLEKQLVKFQHYVTATKRWIKADKLILSKTLKSMSKEEHLEYKYSCGDIGRADYLVIKQGMEERK